MNKLISLLTIAILIGCKISAQETTNPYNAAEIIRQGIELHDAGEYQKAIDLYDKVNRNDSNYVWAITEKSISMLSLKKYDDVVKVCKYAITLNNFLPQVYTNMGNALDELDKKEEALKAYDEGLKYFPMNYLLCYNKAVTLQRLKRDEEAVEYYQRTLWINPKHRRSNLQLGYLCAQEGKYTQAMMSLITYLFLNPSDTTNLEVLSYLDKFVSQKSTDSPKNIKLSDGDHFGTLDMLISNHLALNSKYKLKVSLDYPVVRQSQALVENLKYDPSDNGFWMQFYVPFFNGILKKDDWEGFIYDLLISSSNEKIIKVLNKNIAKIKSFNQWFAGNWVESHNAMLRKNNGKTEKISVARENNKIESLGNYTGTNKRSGHWEYYGADGYLTSHGDYVNGLQQNKWTFYHSNGKKSGEVNFIKGNPDGIYSEYDDEGFLVRQTMYKDSVKNGNIIEFYASGDTLNVASYKNSKRDGWFRSYYSIGSKEYQINYKENKIVGKVFKYYDNGKVEIETDFKDGVREGIYKQYHKTGRIYDVTPYKNGKTDSVVKYYYDNGIVNSEGLTKEDMNIKEYKVYYKNGNPQDIYVYDEKGKLNGTYKHFDIDGKLHYETDYNNDKPVNVRYYNKNGVIIYQCKISKNTSVCKSYNSIGKLEKEGAYENGQMQGVWKYYDIYGNFIRAETYDKGKLNGDVTYYFKNGKIDKKYDFKDGKANGKYIEYYVNGNVFLTGAYVGGDYAGVWENHRLDGTLSHSDYYIEGERNGWQQDYDLSGLLELESFYKYGKLFKVINYDSLGKAYEITDLKTGTGPYSTHYSNKSNYLKGNYVNGAINGVFTGYNPQNNISVEGNYFNNKENGFWKWYNDDGQVFVDGYYFYGEKDSIWKTYFSNTTDAFKIDC